MGTITGLTAERMLAIEAASVVDGDIVGDELFLTKHDGSVLNAGNVRGPIGPEGPRGANLAAASAVQVSDVGIINQIRAGRQLTPADFTNMGLSVPIGLWNLSNLTDASGNGRTLINKAVPQPVTFGSGINGVGSTAAQFRGPDATPANTPVLYIPDTGGADPFRIKTGSWGAWFRFSRRGVQQYIFSKLSAAAGNYSWEMWSSATNLLALAASLDGTAVPVVYGVSDVSDDRWHFGVITYDGTKGRVYVDGSLEGVGNLGNGPIFPGNGPLNIGGRAGDASATPSNAVYGRVDEAFVTNDVLSDEQVRNLYCASIPHTLGSIPSSFALSVRRRRRGAPLSVTDFPSQPVRLHNFTGGVLTDQGSNNVPLVPVGGGTIIDVAGVDGLPNGAKSFAGAHTGLGSTDTGLPLAQNARSIGAWFKAFAATETILGIGTVGSGDLRLRLPGGNITSNNVSDAISGPFVADGQWHLVVEVDDNGAADLTRRKLYIDGRLVGFSTVMTALTPVGANGFRVGAAPNNTLPFVGQIDAPFVFAGTLTTEQIRKIYDIGSQILAPSPKAAADHVEASEAGRLLAIFDSIESSDSIDLAVMA